MRADRLVAILLMLQHRQQVTAAEVAEELEISERTARRDLEALGAAGMPVYSSPGRGGGWRLAGGGKTDLSGLTAQEARALFMVAGPSAQTTPELRAALRKLVRALPEQWRREAESASTAVVVDPVGWSFSSPNDRPLPEFHTAVQNAVIGGHQIRIGYVDRGGHQTERVVEPLGLAAKGSTWYLVAATGAVSDTTADVGRRTFRVDRITSVEHTGTPATRPVGFDLQEAWRTTADRIEELRHPLRVRALVVPHAMAMAQGLLGNRLRIGHAAPDGRVHVEISARNEFDAARHLIGYGRRVEVLDPPEVVAELRRLAAAVFASYGPPE